LKLNFLIFASPHEKKILKIVKNSNRQISQL
jgi:hypothetical protein